METVERWDSNTTWPITPSKQVLQRLDEVATETPQAEDRDCISLKTCVRQHAKAIGWSVLMSTVVIMESFDVVVTTGFFALPSFNEHFSRTSSLSPGTKSAIVNAVLVGEIVGLALCGHLTDRTGYRYTLTLALIALSAFLLVIFFATHIAVFILGQFLCGIPLGVFQTLPAAYASDVLPSRLKPYLTSYVNFCWAVGGLLGSGIQKGAFGLQGEWSWRVPVALQWVWPMPLIIGILFAPESPWHLIRNATPQRAFSSLRRLTPHPHATLTSITRTNALEQSHCTTGAYADLLRTPNRRRTESTVMVWAIQMLTGSTLMYFSTTFFHDAGLSARHSFTLTPVMYAVGCLGTLISWTLIARFPPRAIYLCGTALLAACMSGIGLAGLIDNVAARWAAAALLVTFTAVYDATIGPVCYFLVTELPSSRLKQKSVALARCAYLVLSIVMNVGVPYLLDACGAKCAFCFAGLGCLSVVWIWFRLPETRTPLGNVQGDEQRAV